jgi:glycosyltransferase involved in cell wall biosynthesis
MISVIIPNYNRAVPVIKAVNSVFNQTYKNYEVIVVDDCSTDDSLLSISSINHPKLKVLKLNKNSGAAAARNFGILNSCGDYISLLDSDDYYEPTYLEESFKSIRSTGPEVGFIWTGVRYNEKGKSTDFIWKPTKRENPYLTFLHTLHIGTNSGITFKRTVFDTCGTFREDLPAAEDTEFFLRITKHFDYSIVNQVLINIEKDSSDRLSKNYKKIALAYDKFLPEHYPIIDSEKELQKKYYYKMMWLNYHLTNQELANDYYYKIPKAQRTFKIRIVKNLYQFLPLNFAKFIHLKLST